MATTTRTEHTADPAAERVLHRESVLHPARPTGRRRLRDPHLLLEAAGTSLAPRTTPTAPAPSSARPELGEAAEDSRSDASMRPLVAATTVPDVGGDLLGLPDLEALRSLLRRVGTLLVGRLRDGAQQDARLRARRDEDSAAMARSGLAPTRYV